MMNGNETIPQMLPIIPAAKVLGVSAHFVRQKVLAGEVVAVRAGNKYLVNVDKFIEYLNTTTVLGKEGK